MTFLEVLGAAKKYTDKAIAQAGTGTGAKIDDTAPSNSTVYSSSKVETDFQKNVLDFDEMQTLFDKTKEQSGNTNVLLGRRRG